jgi:ribosomal protein L7/L12
VTTVPETFSNLLIFVAIFSVLMTLYLLSKQLAAVDRKVTRIANHLGIDPMATLALSDRVKELARDPARKIEAIKIYREETGVGLAEAKEAVEAYQRSLGQ